MRTLVRVDGVSALVMASTAIMRAIVPAERVRYGQFWARVAPLKAVMIAVEL